MWALVIGALLFGIFLGRIYGWMKFRYPESREMIAVKVAQRRAERAYWEAREERFRSEIDGSIDARIGR